MLALACDAYARFGHPAVTPLVQLDRNLWALELFHGPTLAFKDVAMQLLARLMDRVLAVRNRRVTVVGATSGDTGGAAVEAFRGAERIDAVVLFPHSRVSDVQRRMMTTATEPNVHAVAVEGTFDDCQALVKAMFNDLAFRDRVRLAGVNSINWARVAAQIAYYFVAAAALGAPHRPVSFSVPTGNFGDIFAGWAARRMGLPIERLVIATNDNDILAPHPCRRRLRGARRHPHDLAVHGHPGRLQLRALAVRGERARCRLGAWADGGSAPVRPLRAVPRGGSRHARRFRRRQRQPGRGGGDASAGWRPKAAIFSTRTAPAAWLPPRRRAPRGRRAVRRARHRPPRQVPRRHAKPSPAGVPPCRRALRQLVSAPERMTVLPNDLAAIQHFVARHAGEGKGAAA